MKNMSKNTKIALGAIVIVIIGALIFRYSRHKKAPEMVPEVTPVTEQVTAPVTTRSSKPKTVPSTVSVDNRGYAELIIAYKDRMVQFGDLCQVRLSDQVYKVGSEILLDNRNNMPLTIKLGSESYDLGAYGHQIITLGTEGKFMIDCGVNQNVATLTVQK